MGRVGVGLESAVEQQQDADLQPLLRPNPPSVNSQLPPSVSTNKYHNQMEVFLVIEKIFQKTKCPDRAVKKKNKIKPQKTCSGSAWKPAFKHDAPTGLCPSL